MVKLGCCFSHP